MATQKIAASYGRTSKEKDDAFSVSSQLDENREYAARNGADLPKAYEFPEDYTGRVLGKERPAYAKIHELIINRKIDMLIIYAVDRFARKVGVADFMLDDLFAYGVELHIVAWNSHVRDTPEDRNRFNNEAAYGDFERRKIIERTNRGKRKKASRNMIVGNTRPLFGYSLNEHKTAFEMNEHANVAEQVLMLYGVDRVGPVEIARRMNAQGYSTPGQLWFDDLKQIYEKKHRAGKIDDAELVERMESAERRRGQPVWTEHVIYAILRNYESYSGTYRLHVNREEIIVTIPPIISTEVAAMIRENLGVGRRRQPRKAETKYQYLMARRLTCGECKHSYVGKFDRRGNIYYFCNGNRGRTTKRCTMKSFRVPDLDYETREILREALLNPQRLFEEWQQQHEVDEAENTRIGAEIENVDRKIVEAQAKLNRTLDRLTDRLDADEEAFFTSQRDNIKRMLADYREEKKRLESTIIKPKVPEETILGFAKFGEEHEEALKDDTDFGFWRGLVEDLNLTATLLVDQGRKAVDFHLFGIARRRYITDLNGSCTKQLCYTFRRYLDRLPARLPDVHKAA